LCIGPYGGNRFPQKAGPLGLGRTGSPGRDEGESFAVLERVVLDGAKDGHLDVFGHSAKSVGKRRTDHSLIDFLPKGRCEAFGQCIPLGDPGLLSSESTGYGR
jgi:hypothetical protein